MKNFRKITFAIFAAFVFIILGCETEPKKTFTITYVTEFGITPSSITVEDGEFLTAYDLPTLTAEGYEFLGWYLGETQVSPDTLAIYKDITLTAKWKKSESVTEPETEIIDPESEDKEPEKNTYIGTKAPDEKKEVGDIVFTDGSAISYEEVLTLTDKQKEHAIAVIFDAEYTIKDGWNFFEGECPIGIGLKDKEVQWCLESANAYNYKGILNSADLMKDGTYYFEEIKKALGENDDTDDEEKYPAYYFCNNYKETEVILQGTAYEDGWYLPTPANYKALMDPFVENQLPHVADKPLKLLNAFPSRVHSDGTPGYFWTCIKEGSFVSCFNHTDTKYKINSNLAVSAGDLYCTDMKPNEIEYVRPVRRFGNLVRLKSDYGDYHDDKYLNKGFLVPENFILTEEQLPEQVLSYGYTFEGWYDGETKVEPGYKVTKDITLVAKWKKNEFIGTKSPTEEKEVGDYIFKDGSSAPSSLPYPNGLGEPIMGIIFYKGTTLNSDNDSTTVRTLGVGFTAIRANWCSMKSNYYKADESIISTITCSSDWAGTHYIFTGDKNGSDNLEQIKEALGENDDTDNGEMYPALSVAKHYKDFAEDLNGTDYESGWYLPSIAELYELLQVKEIRERFNNISDVDFLSSTPKNKDTIYSAFWSENERYVKLSESYIGQTRTILPIREF